MSRPAVFEDFAKSSNGVKATKQATPPFLKQQSKSNKELSVLTQQLLLAQEGERRRIASELHDGLSQSIAMLQVELGMILRQIPPSASSVRTDIKRLRVRVQDLSDEVRQVSHRLHPAVLDHLSLVPALKSLCSEFHAYRNLDVVFLCDGPIGEIPFNVAVSLYRIAQEALSNTVKHANATEVAVSLNLSNGEVVLSITDDGDGFDTVNAKHNPGLGVISMKERARIAGGRFSIESRLGAGTRVEIIVPVQKTRQEKALSSQSRSTVK